MVLSVVFEDGCARVAGVPLSAYTGWQHAFLTPTALSRLAVHCRRAAFDQGWLDPSGGFFSLSRDSHRRRVVEIASEDDVDVVSNQESDAAAIKADPAQFSTVFIVALEVRPEVHATQMPISNHVTARGDVFVTAVGSSSFGLGGNFFAVGLNASDPTAEVFLGTVQLSYVHIDFAMRRPKPLPGEKRQALEAHLQRSLRDGIGCGDKITRLSKELFAGIGVAPLSLRYHRSFLLRPSDYDFNMHLNQSMYQSFALDTLKDAVLQWVLTALGCGGGAGEGAALSSDDAGVLVFLTRLLFAHAGEATDAEVLARAARGLQRQESNRRNLELAVLQLDSCLSSFRIDYVKEVPMVLSELHRMHVTVGPAPDAVRHTSNVGPQQAATCDILFRIASEEHDESVDGIHSCGVARLTRHMVW